MDVYVLLGTAVGTVVTVVGCFTAGWLIARSLWSAVVAEKDEDIAELRGLLQTEHDEAQVAAQSRRDMAADDQARADVRAVHDRAERLRLALARLPRRKPQPPAADSRTDAGAGDGVAG